MKILLNTYTSNESWKVDYMLLEVTADAARKLRADREKCMDFLQNNFGEGSSSVSVPCKFPVSCGSYDWERGGGIYEDDLETQGWTDLTDYLDLVEAMPWTAPTRIECVMVKTFDDGRTCITALCKDSGNTLYADLNAELLNVLNQNTK